MSPLLPNAITALRVVLLPLFAWAVLTGLSVLAPALLVILAGSDWLDGFLARRWRAESRLGAILDPAADKLIQLTGLILLSVFPHASFTPIPPVFVGLVLARDLLLLYGALRIRFSTRSIRIRPRLEGKVATGAVLCLLLASSLRAPPWAVWTLGLAGAPFVIVSGVRYVIDGHRQMAEPRPAVSPGGS